MPNWNPPKSGLGASVPRGTILALGRLPKCSTWNNLLFGQLPESGSVHRGRPSPTRMASGRVIPSRLIRIGGSQNSFSPSPEAPAVSIRRNLCLGFPRSAPLSAAKQRCLNLLSRSYKKEDRGPPERLHRSKSTTHRNPISLSPRADIRTMKAAHRLAAQLSRASLSRIGSPSRPGTAGPCISSSGRERSSISALAMVASAWILSRVTVRSRRLAKAAPRRASLK